MTTTQTPFRIMGDTDAAVRSAHAREKFAPTLARGRANATAAIQSLQNNMPTDALVPAQRLSFQETEGGKLGFGMAEKLGEPEIVQSLHKHALGQIADRSGLGQRTAKQMLEWGRADLLAHNLNEIYHDHTIVRPDTKYLVRSVGDQVRGFLSDRYRRLDTGPILEAFVQAFQRNGAVPVNARCMDTKFSIKVAIGEMFEPIPGEVLLYGMQITNSDYGDGALSVRDYIERLICANGMTGEEGFRKVHLGGRLGDDLLLSQKTYELDTKTIASAIGDITQNLLNPAAVTERMESIKAAASEEINADNRIDHLRKKAKLTKGEAERVAEVYRSADIEMVPAGNTAWRLSNAISLIAHGDDVAPERTLDLEQVAGELIAA